jgi:DnaJ-class molecular chaperone
MAWNAFGRFGGYALAVRGADEIRHDRRWFADEVVVDFPSVAPAVERMRHAFVAEEHPKTLTAALEITLREASEGATVPLDVPVRCTCRTCGGRGETWTQPCATCAGSGFELLRHQVRITIPAGVEDGACFHFAVSARHDLSTRIELRVLVSPPACG